MLTVWGNRLNDRCDGVSRRDFLRVGTLGLAGLSLPNVLRSRAQAAPSGRAAKDTAVILYWLDGGPTHFETYDPKPNAPAEFRGAFKAIPTNVPGVQFSELLVGQARIMDKLAICRSVHHDNGDHFAAAHWMLTGRFGSNAVRQEPMYPAAGAIAAKLRGSNRPGMPPYVGVPQAMSVGLRPGYNSGAYLGLAYNPLDAGGDPNVPNFRVPNLNLASGLTMAHLEDRRNLLTSLDRVRRDIDSTGTMEGLDSFNQQAFEMITGEAARRAFDIGSEDPRVRDKYGRNTYGQSALLARRLVEAGVTFVTVHNGGWDHHAKIQEGMKSRLPTMDQSIAALVEDLSDRGLLDRVLVCVMGEFGRTPRINANAGRDHWGNAMSVLMAGGGLKGGVVVGSTNSKGEAPADRPLVPGDILATMYHVLGIDPTTEFHDRTGRPVPVLSEGKSIAELL